MIWAWKADSTFTRVRETRVFKYKNKSPASAEELGTDLFRWRAHRATRRWPEVNSGKVGSGLESQRGLHSKEQLMVDKIRLVYKDFPGGHRM